jgi:hypothetical protein
MNTITSSAPYPDLLSRIPGMDAPCPLHPGTDRAADLVVRWARQTGLVRTSAGEQRLRAIGSHRLAGRTFHAADFDQLVLFSKWYAWLIMLDDHWDERGQLPAREVEGTLRGLARAVSENGTRTTSAPFERALGDLWRATAALMGTAWRTRFRTQLDHYQDATRWEIASRADGRICSLADYPARRRASFATFIYEAAEAILGIEIPEVVIAMPAWADLRDAATDIGGWCNDVLTQDKDRATGDLTNYVLVAEHELRLNQHDATLRVIDRIAERASGMTEAARNIVEQLSLPPATVIAVATAADGYLIAPRANLEWTLEALRYHAT